MKNKPKPQKSEVSTSVRVFEILGIVADADPYKGLSLAEISNKLNVSKSTIHRHLQTLERINILERRKGNNYHLGWKILSLAGKYLGNIRLPILAEPFMRELSEKTQETIHLAVPANNEVIYIGKINSPRTILMSTSIGGRMPIHSTSLGKSILAYLPENKLDEVIKLGLPKMTPNTITSPEELKTNLEQVRLQGFSFDNMENEDDVRCIGASIFDYTQLIIGGISLSGPANRITLEDVKTLGPQVKETALSISRRMGYPK